MVVPTLALLGIALTLVALVALLAADHRKSKLGKWLAKPTASAGFLLAAWGFGAADSAYGQVVLIALVFAAAGDVLLIADSEVSFLAGLGSFLLGHVGFGVAFVVRGVVVLDAAVVFAVLAVPAIVVWRWLSGHVPEGMKLPVVSYIVVITLMVALGASTFRQWPNWVLLLGVVGFYLSDLSVARDRFVHESFSNRLWGLPLYYGAELLLAASTGVGTQAMQ